MSRSYYLSFFTTTFFIVISVFASGCVRKIDLRTVYMDPPPQAVGVHRISIEGTLGETGKVYFDPNACWGIDQFGDPGACQLVLGPTVEVRIEQIELEDKKGKGRKVYQLIGNFPHSDYKYYLVVPSSKQGVYRLVVGEATVEEPGVIKRWGIVTLERRN